MRKLVSDLLEFKDHEIKQVLETAFNEPFEGCPIDFVRYHLDENLDNDKSLYSKIRDAMMFNAPLVRVKRIGRRIETIFKTHSVDDAIKWLDNVIKSDSSFITDVNDVRFIDGCVGKSITKSNGDIVQYKVEEQVKYWKPLER